MRISDYVANYILELLEENEDESVEIKRNELANTIGCVPSQINYVITSRFTPEQGYLVESQRGGGGYIRITRVSMDRVLLMMHVINAVGASIDAQTAAAVVKAVAEVARAEGVSVSGFRVVASCGRDGAQSVEHLHFHLLGGAALSERMT